MVKTVDAAAGIELSEGTHILNDGSLGQFAAYPTEHVQTTPEDETVVDRCVQTIGSEGIAPTKSVRDHGYHAAHGSLIIAPRACHAPVEHPAEADASAPRSTTKAHILTALPRCCS